MDCSSTGPSDRADRVARPELSAEAEASILSAACRRVAAAVRRERSESSRAALDATAEQPSTAPS